MTRHLCMLFLGVVLTTPVRAAEPAAWCYESGLKLAVLPREGSPVLGIATVFDGGSTGEAEGEEGAAHALEHLWFRSPRLGYDSFDALVDAVGGEANAFTTHDETLFLTVAPRQALRALIQVEAERLADPLGAIDDGVLRTELEVIRNELRERYSGADPALQAVLDRLIVDEDPYARSVGGTEEQVAALDREALSAYASRTHRPEHASLFLVGAVDPEAVRRIVEQTLPREALSGASGRIRPRPCTEAPDHPLDPMPVPPHQDWKTVEAGVDEPVHVMAWSVPVGTRALRQAEAAAGLFGYALRVEADLDASCDVVPLRRTAVLMCVLEPEEADDAEPWKKAQRALDRMKRQLSFTHSRSEHWQGIQRGLALLRRKQGAREAEVLWPGGWLEERAIKFHRTRAVPTLIARSAPFTGELLDAWLTEERGAGVVLVPPEGSTTLASSFHGARGAERSPDPPGTVDEARLARIVVDPGFAGLEVREVQDRPVWIAPVPGLDRPRASAVYPSDGSEVDPALLARTWELVAGPWDQLKKRASRQAWSAEVDLRLDDADHYWSYSAVGPETRSVVAALGGLAAPPVKLVSKKEDRTDHEAFLEWREEASTEPRWLAARKRWRALSDGLPHPSFDDAALEARMAVDRGAAKDLAREILDRDRARIVAIAAPGEEDAIRRAVALHFEPAGASEDAERTLSEPRSPAARSVTVVPADRPGPQAVIDVDCRVEEGDSVVAWVIEKALHRSLNDALRNDLGITYGVHPDFTRRGHGPTLEISTRVPQPQAGVAVGAILQSVEDAAGGKLDPEAIDRFKLDVARGTALRWQDPALLLSMLEDAAARGLDPTDLDLAARLAAVDVESIAERLASCAEHEAITVIGDPEVLLPALEEAGIAAQPLR